jgi:hypothetical protein
MKFTALSLIPMLVTVALLFWLREKAKQTSQAGLTWWRNVARRLVLMALAAWAILMVVYFPNWAPAPPLGAGEAERLGVPAWYQVLRPILVPKDFFKGMTLLIGHVREGGDSYLMGRWYKTGCWYYYPLAMAVKSPLPFLVLILAGLYLTFKRRAVAHFEELIPWIAAAVYLVFSMTSKINIGIRHVLPLYPLLAVGTAAQVARAGRKLQIGAWILAGWLGAVALAAYPYYIQYFNEFTGGSRNGYQYLIDSNFDWGQDAKRLKKFLDDHDIKHIYLDYFGTQASIEYYKIPNTRVTAEQARQISEGYLVVSASQLMRSEWAWLRESHQPIERLASTLFVYKLP